MATNSINHGNAPMLQQPVPVAANVMCFLAMLTWAAAFPATEILLESWGTISLMAFRLVLAVSALMVYWWWKEGGAVIKAAPWRPALWIGAIGFGAGMLLLLMGQRYSDAVTPALAAAMTPIVGAALEVMFDGRKLRPRLVTGMLLALLGGYLATGAKLSQGTFGLGAMLCILAAVMFTWGTRATTRSLPGQSALAQGTMTLVGAMFFIPLAWGLAWATGYDALQIGSFDPLNIFCLLVYALIAMSLSQVLWITAAGKLGIFVASLHMNAVPFYVMVAVVLVFGEPWNWMQAVGAALVGAGVIVAQAQRIGLPKRRRFYHQSGVIADNLGGKQNEPASIRELLPEIEALSDEEKVQRAEGLLEQMAQRNGVELKRSEQANLTLDNFLKSRHTRNKL